ncbi:MAG: hypothetical protein EPN91_10530 [Salinibacterium sp.]|nr:MAG: hypothetical protein EPN91_10530 [Salinibacterium sp.]
MTDDDFDFTPWTPEGAERLRVAARDAAQAIIEHGDFVAGLSARSDSTAVFDSAQQLAESLVAFAGAQFDYTGITAPLGGVYEYLENQDEEDEEEDRSPVSGLSILERRDYEVIDEDAVISAGRLAYLRIWADDTEQDAERDVNHLGSALYQIAHDSGTWRSLDDVEGLRPTGATVLVLPVDTTLGADPHTWPENPFEADPAAAIFTQSDVFAE